MKPRDLYFKAAAMVTVLLSSPAIADIASDGFEPSRLPYGIDRKSTDPATLKIIEGYNARHMLFNTICYLFLAGAGACFVMSGRHIYKAVKAKGDALLARSLKNSAAGYGFTGLCLFLLPGFMYTSEEATIALAVSAFFIFTFFNRRAKAFLTQKKANESKQVS